MKRSLYVMGGYAERSTLMLAIHFMRAGSYMSVISHMDMPVFPVDAIKPVAVDRARRHYPLQSSRNSLYRAINSLVIMAVAPQSGTGNRFHRGIRNGWPRSFQIRVS